MDIEPSPDHDPAEVTLRESVKSAAADLADLGYGLALGEADPARSAQMAERLSEELAEIGQMARSLPGRPVDEPAHLWQLVASLRRAHAEDEDVAAFVARGLARLAAELGSTWEVLANRPGSWEAGLAAELLRGTVGDDLAAWRTTR